MLVGLLFWFGIVPGLFDSVTEHVHKYLAFRRWLLKLPNFQEAIESPNRIKVSLIIIFIVIIVIFRYYTILVYSCKSALEGCNVSIC